MSHPAGEQAQTVYDLVVIGRGMIGSAAAKYASQQSGQGKRVALVGPDEPSSDEVGSREIFGAHYDEGRITRKTDMDPTWALLAARSIDRYREIEQTANMSFYSACGHLAVAPEGSEALSKREENAKTQNVAYQRLSSAELRECFPYLNFPPGSVGVYETEGAGYISARELVRAQTCIAEQGGVEIFREEASAVDRIQGGEANFAVSLQGGAKILSDKVLVAAGAFVNSRPLLPAGANGQHVTLEVTGWKTQTVQVEVAGKDTSRLRGMPSVIFRDESRWCYLLPPIQYPDGKVIVKLGGGPIASVEGDGRELKTHEEMVAWYRGEGDVTLKEMNLEMLHEIVPDLEVLSVRGNACVTAHTPSVLPFVGPVQCGGPTAGLTVVAGGNGYAAKSSDELGRLAALCALESQPVPRESPSAPGESQLAGERALLAGLSPAVRAPFGASAELAASWSAASPGYRRIFVGKFRPWTDAAMAALRSVAVVPEGDVLVPCCGPGQELPLLDAWAGGGRAIAGVDLSPGMVALAAEEARRLGPHVTAHVGDAMAAEAGRFALVLSVFGLQQLPDQPTGLAAWVRALKPGGVGVVCFWPGDMEEQGPWIEFMRAMQALAAPWRDRAWEGRLVGAVEEAGGEVVRDEYVKGEMRWDQGVDEFWSAMTAHGPWEAVRRRRGDEFLAQVRERWTEQYYGGQGPTSGPIAHEPSARLLVFRRKQEE